MSQSAKNIKNWRTALPTFWRILAQWVKGKGRQVAARRRRSEATVSVEKPGEHFMNEDDRRRFDSLFQLYDASRQRFNERRNYEFKIAIGFWAVLIAAIAGSITLAELPPIPHGNTALIVAACLLLFVYLIWTKGLYKSAQRDRLQGISYGDALDKIVSFEFDAETQRYTKKVRLSFLTKYWAVIFEISITCFLILILVLLNLNKLESNGLRQSQKTRLDLENRRLELENLKLEIEIERLKKEVEPPSSAR